MMPTAAWSCVNVLSFGAAQSHIGYRGDYLSWRGLEGGRPIGVNLRRGGAANSSPPPCGEGLGVGVVRGGTALPQPPDPPPRPSPSRNRVYAGFGHSIKRSKSATADFDWGRETRRHCHHISQRLWEVRARQRAGKGGRPFSMRGVAAVPTRTVFGGRTLPLRGPSRGGWRRIPCSSQKNSLFRAEQGIFRNALISRCKNAAPAFETAVKQEKIQKFPVKFPDLREFSPILRTRTLVG